MWRFRFAVAVAIVLFTCRSGAVVSINCVKGVGEQQIVEECFGASTRCYTLEPLNDTAIQFGCATVDKFGNSMGKCTFSEYCPPPPYALRSLRGADRLCCCNSSFCNAPLFASLNNDSAEPVFKVRVEVHSKSKSKKTKKGSSLGALVGIASGVVLVACVVGAAVVVQVKRRAPKLPKELRPEEDRPPAVDTMPENSEGQDGSPAEAAEPALQKEETSPSASPGTETSAEQSASVSSVSEPSSVSPSIRSVLHLDRTHKSVPSQLLLEEQLEILRQMRNPMKLKFADTVDRPPAVIKVITYSTSDDITMMEESAATSTVEALSSEQLASLPVCDNIDRLISDQGLLTRLVLHGPKEFPFEGPELADLLDRGTDVFLREPPLLEVPVPCVVYGDIHGQYSDLHRWFNLNGWPPSTRCVFLGDFVDRGSHGIEVVALIVALKLEFPDRIFVCRGNHEDERLNRGYSFHDEVVSRFPAPVLRSDGREESMYAPFKRLFASMAFAVLIAKRILGMHGGISSNLTSLELISQIARPLRRFQPGTLPCDLVWSDPDRTKDCSGYRSNTDREPTRGIGQLFAADTVEHACKLLGVDMILRGHQAPLHGYATFANGLLITLFSAPGYKGSDEFSINMGASIIVSSSLELVIKQIQVTTEFRKKRVQTSASLRNSRKTRIPPTRFVPSLGMHIPIF